MDLAGLDEFQEIDTRYLRGSSGFIIVVDGTRKDTLDHGLAIRDRALETVPDASIIFALNKMDIADEWEFSSTGIPDVLSTTGANVIKTSAKTGEGVDEMFTALATSMMESTR